MDYFGIVYKNPFLFIKEKLAKKRSAFILNDIAMVWVFSQFILLKNRVDVTGTDKTSYYYKSKERNSYWQATTN